ncbi:MAG: SRPBCC family protein [Marmoricola sp.]|nr:SRPBCC family protein [Marmoricola sp.]
MSDFRYSPAEHLGTVSRELRDGEREGTPLRVLVVERRFAAAPEEVWSAITTPERIPRWLAPVSGDLRPGGRFQVEGNAGGEVLACEEPTRLEVTWEYGGDTSWVEVTLLEHDEGTLLRLEHAAPVPPQLWEEFGPGAVGIGWEMMLMGIAEHVADPAFSAAEVQSFLASPEGQAYVGEYMTASSRAWGVTQAAYGTDPAQAEAAAARCLAAYTGADAAEDTEG